MGAVAVKVIALDASEQQRADFEREVRILESCRDRNIVQFLGSCADGTQTLLVTEFMDEGAPARLPACCQRPRAHAHARARAHAHALGLAGAQDVHRSEQQHFVILKCHAGLARPRASSPMSQLRQLLTPPLYPGSTQATC